MQSIRKYLSTDELIKYLETEKKLIFPTKESKEKFKLYLTQYNYNFFVKGLKNNLMFDEKRNYKKEFNSDQIRYLFDLDRRISAVIFKYFKSLEFLLNNSFTAVISKEIFKLTQTPYIATLSKDEFTQIFSNYSNPYGNHKVNYDPLINIISEFYKYFYEENFFNKTTFKNKDSENENVIKKIEKSWFLKDNYYSKICPSPKRNWIYAEFFSITYLLTFSQIIKLIKALNNDLKNQIIKNVFKKFNEHEKTIVDDESFSQIIEMFSNLRNFLAHNSNIIKFRYQIDKENFNLNILKILNHKKGDQEIIFSLNDAIAILEKIIGTPKNKIINEIKNEIKEKSNISLEKGNDLSDLLLQIIEDETKIQLK